MDGHTPGSAPTGRDVRRVTIDPQGPLLVEGPVEVALPDGGTARSDRFVVAVCTCRRSRRYPWCDTSHRRRTREKPSRDTTD
ncbi:CDGSH iron-sulfur domain-containing protein [Streptomyces sp. CA-294286]|uniref:CDGSH iron-sulfur domain-containing protein n=1 Tax=Streptomyces sp. CA-294286 TaxID=3240070 RepID=UPI003D8AA69B